MRNTVKDNIARADKASTKYVEILPPKKRRYFIRRRNAGIPVH